MGARGADVLVLSPPRRREFTAAETEATYPRNDPGEHRCLVEGGPGVGGLGGGPGREACGGEGRGWGGAPGESPGSTFAPRRLRRPDTGSAPAVAGRTFRRLGSPVRLQGSYLFDSECRSCPVPEGFGVKGLGKVGAQEVVLGDGRVGVPA